MPDIIADKICAEPEGEIVLFLIGMRLNKLWKFWKWLPVLGAMPKMLRELAAHPELGLLSARGHYGPRNLMVVQYWRSVEQLQAYARADDRVHLPAWHAFYRHVGVTGDVGIWHETYVIRPGQSEALYVNMPRFGLGLAAPIAPARGHRATASGRMTGSVSAAA